MSSELPPTEYFSGINFNPDFYSSGSDNITNEEAQKKYLTYDLITPTITKSSLGYYVNYAKVSAAYAASNKYLYAPTSNTATTDSNYLNAGVYMANIHLNLYASAGQTYSSTFTLGVATGTNIQTMPVNSQYGSVNIKSDDFIATNTSANITGNNFIFSHSGCFTLTSSSFVHLQFYMTVQSGATQSYNLYGCIHRIG